MDRAKLRWAPRLQPGLLERLYASDARGLRDLELCEAVGSRLHARCRAYVLVHEDAVDCPSCGTVYTVARRGESPCPGAGCGWSTTWPAYRQSVRDHYAFTGRAMEAFSRFHDRYPAARSYRDKILLIDELIHSFHRDEARAPAKSVASKLLQGSKDEAVRFLDRLSARDPAAKERWREAASRTIHRRVLASR